MLARTREIFESDTVSLNRKTIRMSENWHDLQLESRIGQGTFGAVYRARDRRSRALLALKLIDLEAADDEIEEVQVRLKLINFTIFLFVYCLCIWVRLCE